MPSPQKYTVLKSEFVSEYKAKITLYEHTKTKAQVMVVDNDDVNKVFGITFRTPWGKSQGIAHILEHSVLCGSEKYPVKEPFVELIKSSLNTFINAFTYPDKTCYPVASTNAKDLYNMTEVYLDAVFKPNITKETFLQEGWHYELENSESALTYKGVVFNEMKGVYSDPENVLARYVQASVLPDTVYGVDSGGDPTVIPSLTFEQFTEFHRTHYHPSNSMIYFYGDDHSDKKFELLDEYLDQYEYLKVDSQIEVQTPKTIHTEITMPYDPGEKSDAGNYVVISWLLNEQPDYQAKNMLELTLLNQVLLGNPGAPLYKALMESGLGDDLTNTYLEPDLQQCFMSVGIKGVKTENIPKVRELIYSTLRELVKNGVNAKTVESSLNAMEFSEREQNTGRYPRGLSLMLSALQDWNYGGDPIRAIQFEEDFMTIRQRLLDQPNTYFSELITKYILDNVHVNQAVLYPDVGHGSRVADDEKNHLSEVKSKLTTAQINDIVDQTTHLKLLQTTPDAVENLAKIPKLHIDDVKEIPVRPEFHTLTSDENMVYTNSDIFTNGIVYMTLLFDLSAVDADLFLLIKLLWRASLEMDGQNRSFVELNQDIDFYTGGIYFNTIFDETLSGNPIKHSCVHLKCLEGRIDQSLELLTEVLTMTKLDNQTKFKQILTDTISSLEGNLVPAGHNYVMSYLQSQLSPISVDREQISGISALQPLKNLLKMVENNWSEVLGSLISLRSNLLHSPKKIVHITAPQAIAENIKNSLQTCITKIQNSLPAVKKTSLNLLRSNFGSNPAFILPTQVNYVGKGINLYKNGYKFHGPLLPIVKYIGTEYLWEKVRVVGGAYGGFARFNQTNGVFLCCSYRDPNLLGTLKIYDQIADMLSNVTIDQDSLNGYIIGCIGDWDGYKLPDAQGFELFTNHLKGVTSDYLNTIRSQILATKLEDFHQFGVTLKPYSENGKISSITSQAKFDEDYVNSPFEKVSLIDTQL